MTTDIDKDDVTYPIVETDGDVIIFLNHLTRPFAPWPREPGTMMYIKYGKSANGNEPRSSYLVSSRHLMLASDVFRTKLSTCVKNSFDLLVYEEEEKWHPEAFFNLMCVLHNLNEQVPERVDLDRFTMLVSMVNHYHCKEAFKPHYWRYMNYFCQDELPSEYCRNMILWLYISIVYIIKDDFRKLTRVAMRTMRDDKPIDTLGLGIHRDIVQKIQDNRSRAIENFALESRDPATKFFSENYECELEPKESIQCGAIMLGGIVKVLNEPVVLNPEWNGKLEKVSLKEIFDRYHKVASMGCVTYIPDDDDDKIWEPHACKFADDVEPLIDRAEDMVEGLDMDDVLGYP